MAEESKLTWEGVALLVIGAILAVGGGFVSNWYQASTQLKITQVQQDNQIKQLLFSNKVAALQALGAAASKSSGIVALSLMDFHTNLSTANLNREATIQALKSCDKAIREMINWKREVGQGAMIVEVLFKVKQPQIESLKVDVPNLSEDVFTILADEKERERMISIMKKNEEIMLAHASKIATEFRAYLDKVGNILLGDNP